MKISAIRMTLGSRKPSAYQPFPPATPPVREERVVRQRRAGHAGGSLGLQTNRMLVGCHAVVGSFSGERVAHLTLRAS